MVRESQGDSDYSNMNSAVSSESMDLAEEDMSQVDGCGLSGGSEDEDECASSPAGSAYEDGADVIKSAMSDEVTKQLAAAGPVGMAAAAAIASSKKRKRPHSFETNPSVRKRHQNRLLRKLRQTIEEFATRVGQQAVVLVATPGKPNTSYRVFGAKPLEDVVRNLRCMIMEELENALAQQFGLGGCPQAPPPPLDDPSLFELPPLIIDGIPTPVEKMTQAQLRAFIPLMLKYSMVRGKPGWGRESTRPPWWPKDLPWANVRMDARSEDEKQKMSWTHALRQIVINCYKYHGREDLLPAFTEDEDDKITVQQSCAGSSSSPSASGARAHANAVLSSSQVCIDQMTLADVDMSQYAPAVLQTITNPDGSVSLIQVDPSNHIITLPDGTTAQVVSIDTRSAENTRNWIDGSFKIHSGEGGGVVQALEGDGAVAVDLNAVAEATLNHDGQIILTGEDGHGYPVSVSGVITVPVSASVYQSMVASMQQQDGVCVAPLVQVEQNGETLEAISMGGGVAQVMLQGGGEAQVLQVLSLKDATVLTKAMQVKSERDAVAADS
ncbi:DNA-binding protein P3A2 isoform X1 [Vanessa cardui]|uniref:DNA-binding protein P3A2 isoform X1 n=1 Tax=Vanessa cardui TaxID=171605 RepID=UPI001F12CF85|nr:DNA-binding protein P3A2 isoform X1 [Vanessa cardui]XP_046963176.1 DNA-binding protein P3A2 isoform X1 [Vanessa cardui]